MQTIGKPEDDNDGDDMMMPLPASQQNNKSGNSKEEPNCMAGTAEILQTANQGIKQQVTQSIAQWTK